MRIFREDVVWCKHLMQLSEVRFGTVYRNQVGYTGSSRYRVDELGQRPMRVEPRSQSFVSL